MLDMFVVWTEDETDIDGYLVEEKIENQTMRMELQKVHETMDTRYYGIYLTLFNKKTQIDDNEHKIKSTGLNPIQTYYTAKKLLNELIGYALEQYEYISDKDIVIFCTWLDNRRRDAYYKVLSKYGFRYGKHILTGEKVIMKKYKKGCEFNGIV